VKMKNTQ